MKKELESRINAFKTLSAVFKGQRLDFAMDDMPMMEEQDKAFSRMLVMTTIRRNGEINEIINALVKNKIPNPKVEVILKLGLCQLMFLETAEYAAINTTVEMTKTLKLPRYSSLVNGVLRSFQRRKEEIKTNPINNIPNWLKKHITEDLGKDKLQQIANSILTIPPLYLTIKDNPAMWAKELEGITISNKTIKISSQKINDLKGYDEGEWWVQDYSASLPVTLFGEDLKGKEVADFCSAPGGKTAQLATMGANVTAFDISAKRIETMKENFKRLNINPMIVNDDASKYLAKNPKQFDYILLDAPCSAVGTVRRNPDILLKNSFSLPTAEQEKLLNTAFTNLKKGGRIVYAVCSFLSKEGEKQIDKFISKNKNAKKIPVKLDNKITCNDNMLITPDYMIEHGGVDGFFAAVIEKI